MRSKNPELMKEISAYVDAFYRANHFSPSLSEIANGVNVAKTTVYRYLVEMNERGLISYDGRTIESTKIDKCSTGYFSAPIVGSIRCGDPEAEEEHVEEYVNYGIEKKKFNEEWKILQKEYEEAGMSEKSIQEIYEFDLNVFRKNRTEINHTQPFTDNGCAEGNVQGESMSTLLQKFQSELSCGNISGIEVTVMNSSLCLTQSI